jgi:hypothetical protein
MIFFVSVCFLQGSTSAYDTVLAVTDEETSEPMLLHRITPDDIYRKREGEASCCYWFLLSVSVLAKFVMFNKSANLLKF